MSSSFVPRGRKFQPRIPRETLLEMTSNEVKSKGVEHISQARLMLAIAGEICHEKSPKFIQLHGRARVRKDDAWNRAYTLVTNFLKSYQMENTLEAIEIELPETREIKLNKDVDSNNTFNQILSLSRSKRKTFSARLKEWKIEEERLNPQPAFVKPSMKDVKKTPVGHVSLQTKPPPPQQHQQQQQPKPNANPLKLTEMQKPVNASIHPIVEQHTASLTKQLPLEKPLEQFKDVPIQKQQIENDDDDDDNLPIQFQKKMPNLQNLPLSKQPNLKLSKQGTFNQSKQSEQELEIDFSTDASDDFVDVDVSDNNATAKQPQLDSFSKDSFVEDYAMKFETENTSQFESFAKDSFVEDSLLKHESANTSQFESFTKEMVIEDSALKVEHSKSSGFESFGEVIKEDSQKQSFVDSFEESSKIDVVQKTDSDDLVEIDDDSKADVAQESDDFLSIDDWDA